MDTIVVIFKLVVIIGSIPLSVWWFITWMGMHNNMADGNTFKLILPFYVFDKDLFNEKGNKWRLRQLYTDAIILFFSLIYWIAQFFHQPLWF